MTSCAIRALGTPTEACDDILDQTLGAIRRGALDCRRGGGGGQLQNGVGPATTDRVHHWLLQKLSIASRISAQLPCACRYFLLDRCRRAVKGQPPALR